VHVLVVRCTFLLFYLFFCFCTFLLCTLCTIFIIHNIHRGPQKNAATEFSCGGRFYFTVFCSLSTHPKLKELLKSVHICQSYRKIKSGTFSYGRCIILGVADLSQARSIQLAMIHSDNMSTTSTVPGQIVIRVFRTNRVFSCIRFSAPILRDDASEKSRLWSSRTRPMR